MKSSNNGTPSPLDAVLRQLMKSADPAIRRWARRLLTHGDYATGKTESKKSGEKVSA
jgi:hypothetical protein